MKQERKASNPYAPAVPRLWRALSLHEIAVLLLLASAPVETTAATPDYLALQSAGLVDVVNARFALTDSGKAVLCLLDSA
ncbi:hypothetical protein AB3X93_01325 [Paraburkholderia sp. BR14262]|uniref:hypothetical protein n=1 Tax=Paraburkholderia sp. BR14311 TaxID=3237002 RepID=UPI0034CE0C56